MTPKTRSDYPSEYPPGKHWSTDAAWEMLDVFGPGAMPDEVRFLLAGMIAGRLQKERNDAARHFRRLEANDE